MLILILTVLSFYQPIPTDDYSDLIYPDPEARIIIVTSDNVDRSLLSGQFADRGSALVQTICEQLEIPYHQSVIKLNQCARNLADNNSGPNTLFLSSSEGGFVRKGLILSDAGELMSYPDLYYVDLVMDEEKIDRGEMYIFSHELAHVMMNNIWAERWNLANDSFSPKQHTSMGITDYHVAFSEGWAIHFESYANAIDIYRDALNHSYDPLNIPASLWHSNIDKDLRTNAVVKNEYIFRRFVADASANENLEEIILLNHTSPAFDKTRLLNAQQMLSCEGFVATVFQKITTNQTLRENYLDNDFYNNFLLDAVPGGASPEKIFTPFENVILKCFWIMQKLKEKGDSIAAKPLIMEFIKQWATSFPEDRETIYSLFIRLTIGKTVDNSPSNIFEKMAFLGIKGDYFVYRDLRDQYSAAILNLIQRVLNNEIPIDANVGPAIWITNENFPIRRTLWNEKNKYPLSININTANKYELSAVLEIDLETAEKIIRKRDKHQYFISLDQLELERKQ